MPRLAVVVTPLLVWSLWAPASSVAQSAQDARGDSPAHISVVDGAASLERDGQSESAPASMPLLAGDRIRTQNGRVEILFDDGSTLHLDGNTLVDFQSDEVVRLLGGRVRLNILGAGAAARTVSYRVDAPSAWVQIARAGEYRVSIIDGPEGRGDDVELAVLRGGAELVNEDGRTVLGAGERAFARAGSRPSPSYVFNSAAWDDFDRWSEARRDSRLGVSAEYLPENVQTYASTFNQYGYWQNEPTYGNVWYPRVQSGWRPYYYGRWTTLRPWGWTWIGSDPWAWPTHHYGRWGFSAGAWFWIPGRTWGPAWVSWAYAPGYVSWCPLGWNNRAVFGFNVGVYGGHRYNGWNAWTVVPHNGFGRGYVNVNVVNHTRIDVRTRNAFVIRDGAPDNRGYAVPRSSAAIRSVGARGPSSGANGSFSASRTAPAGVSSSNTVAGDSGAAFRSRRSSSAPLTGSGYPAPVRQPRDISSLPAPTRQAVPRSRDANATAPPSTRSTSSPQDIRTAATPDTRSFSERRAVPRASSAPIDQGNVAEPSRRSPTYRTPDASSSNPYSRAEAYRAVPRTDRPARESDSPAPAPSFGTSPQRSYPSGVPDSSDRMYRATPRSTPDNSSQTPTYRAPEGYRSRPGPERSAPAPSGPPPQSAAPSRPSGSSGGESRSGGDGGSRTRSGSGSGGGQPSGRAVPRGGRG